MREVMERLGNFSEVSDESSVKVTESGEHSDILNISGSFPVVDRFNLYVFHFKSLVQEFHSKEVDLFLVKFTLPSIECDSSFAASL
jgi:hypothetical protein